MSNVLVTGGAGFIGSFIVDRLVKQGHFVRIFDNLEPRVHDGRVPSYLNKEAEFIRGDVRNYSELSKALDNVDIVFHEASLVGIEPSMKDPKDFVDTNVLGTSNLMDIIIKKNLNIKKIILPGTVAIYGEGVCVCGKCGQKKSEFRSDAQLKKQDWEIKCDECGTDMKPIGISESKTPFLNNLYSLTKFDQEKICQSLGKKYGIPVAVLRYFNVYGPRQSPTNPYSGVVTRFINEILAGKQISIFEDGNQSRDFVNVHDIAEANMLAMESSKANFGAFNVGMGLGTSVERIAKILSEVMGAELKPTITNSYRAGDMRHCTADISKIRNVLGFKPRVGLKEGLIEVVEWYRNNKIIA